MQSLQRLLLRKMPQVYKRRTPRSFGPEDICRAFDMIRQGATVKGISWCRTLIQYKNEKTIRDIPRYVTANKVFTLGEDVQLSEYQYLETSSVMFYGLWPAETRRLTFEFAARLGKKMRNWEETRMTGADWLRAFLWRTRLSLRTA